MFNAKDFGVNEVDDRDGFFISYNPKTDVGAETAIVYQNENDDVYKILLGDYREEYKDLSLKDCLKVFEKNIDKVSPWSN